MDNPEVVYKLSIDNLSAQRRDITIALLDSFGVEAIHEAEHSLYLFHEDVDFLMRAQSHISDRLDGIGVEDFKLINLPNQNWNQVWESSFKPIVIPGFCAIKATFHKAEFDTPLIVTIDPEMAFGTGHHETTYQMIENMKSMDFTETTVLDFGCGTGLLAIVAEMLGATSVDAIDNDPQAIDCAKKCLQLNSATRIKLFTGELDLLKAYRYDFILANINRNVLIDCAYQMSTMLKDRGVVLLSGILEGDETTILTTFEQVGFRHLSTQQKGGWLCIQLQLHQSSLANDQYMSAHYFEK